MSKDLDIKSTEEGPAQTEPQLGEIFEKPDNNNDFEVFRKGDGGVDFRTVGWIQTSMIYMKITFATGVLSLPSACYVLGAIPGAISIICWQALNTYCGIVQGNFRNSYAHCHSIADMAEVVGGKWLRELAGVLFLASYSIAAASAVFGASVGMNTLSNHGLCTSCFLAITAIAVFILASVRKFEKMAWLTWIGFISIFSAVLIVVIGVAVQSRPDAAPKQGDFDLGYHLIGSPTFIAGMTASATIFCSGAGTAAFFPVISEMKKPQDYQKAVYTSMGAIIAAYLTLSVVVYYYCGKWTAFPSLGSAGPLLQKVSYGVGMPGLLIGACLFVHVAGKYLFVRILRNSEHLQKNNFIHWGTWLGCTAGLSVLTFILASAIPIFNYLVALAGSLTFVPLSLALPGILWLHDHMNYRNGTALQRVFFILNIGLVALGLFMTVGGTYSVIQQIIEAYANGQVSSAFSCADNSNISR